MLYDVIVVGLGAMGSAASYQLTRLGATVLGIDQYTPPHQLGSTHGDTRITRLAVGEGLEYVPLVRRSHEIWRDIEEQTGDALLQQCGGLLMAVPDGRGRHGVSDFLGRTLAAANQYAVPHEALTASQLQTRFPQFELTGAEQGYYEPAAGFVRPEKCVEAQLRLAQRGGAELRFGERVTSYRDAGHGVTVTTPDGAYSAAKVIISAGPWVNELIPDLASRFTVYRQVLYWFALCDAAEYPSYADLPVFMWEFGAESDDFVYGFPMVDGPAGGVKVATESYGAATTPDAVTRDVSQQETAQMYERYVAGRLPGLSPRCVKARSCLYTVTADGRFVIDVHPIHPNVIVASPCSGHGFKHSAAIGEVLAQLATTGVTGIDISAFGLHRPARSG